MDFNHDEELNGTSSLAKSAFGVSLWSLIVSVATVAYVFGLESQKIDPDTLRSSESVRLLGNWMVGGVQLLVLFVGGLVGGTLGVVGLSLSSRSLGDPDNRLAKTGLGLSFVSLALLALPVLLSMAQ